MTEIRVRPFGKHVVVRLLPEPEPSTLIVTPIRPALLRRRAVVEDVGQGVTLVEVGWTVLCSPMLGMEAGDRHLLPENAILCRVTE